MVCNTACSHCWQVYGPSTGLAISTYSAVCLIRGRAYEALDNRAQAIQWYKAAVIADPFCEEAFSALIGNHMLTNSEELQLVDSLQLSPADRWLKVLYRSKCKKVRACSHTSVSSGKI